MQTLSLGLGLTGTTPTTPAPPAQITATVAPSASAMYHSQVLSTLSDHSTNTNTGNYASVGETISTASYQTQEGGVGAWTNRAAGYAVQEGQAVRVLVTDSAANEQAYPIEAAVEAMYSASAVVGNKIEVTLSALPADGATLLPSIVVTGTYAATYSGITAGDLRDIYNWGDANSAGLPTISGSTGLGDTLTADPGLWSSPNGTPTYTFQWQADTLGNGTFVNIGGATSATYDIAASEQGDDVRCVVTGDDGTDTLAVNTAATSVPAAASSFDVTQVGGLQTSSSNTATPSISVDRTGYADGSIVLGIFGRGARPTGATLGGNAMTDEGYSGGNAGGRVTVFSYALQSGDTGSLTMEMTLSSPRTDHQWGVWIIENGVIDEVLANNNSGGSPAALSPTPTDATNKILGIMMGRTMGAGNASWTGPTETLDVALGSFAEADDVPVSAYSVQGSTTDSDRTGHIAIAISEAP